MSVGDWQPGWIGDAARPLYAALHAAPGAEVGVLMLPPLLHEQPRSRRVLVEVASRLAEAGLPCLRFDYYGTGESGGAGDEHDFASIHADLDVALAALQAQAAVARVVVLAWRASILPACAWADAHPEVAALAGWEPVVDGAAWVAGLEAADRDERRERYTAGEAQQVDAYLMGFPTSPRWRGDFSAARLQAPKRAPLWVLARAEGGADAQRHFALPADAPRFDDGIGIENAMFLSRKLFGVVDDFAHAARAA